MPGRGRLPGRADHQRAAAVQPDGARQSAGLTIGSLVLGVLLLAGFVVAERRGSHPLLPLHVILDRTRGGSSAAVGLSGPAW